MKELEIDGYFTIVENEILDLLLILKLTKRQIKTMLAAVRLLNGFNKKKDKIPLSQFSKVMRMGKGHCSKTVNELIEMRMLCKKEGDICINKDFKQWEGVTDLVTLKGLPIWVKKVTVLGNKKVTNLDPSKDTPKTLSKQRGDHFVKLSGKEIDKLEGDPWYKAVMYNAGGFSIFYIQGTVDDYPFNTRMSCWYLYEEAKNVRDKEAYFSKLLRDYYEKKE